VDVVVAPAINRFTSPASDGLAGVTMDDLERDWPRPSWVRPCGTDPFERGPTVCQIRRPLARGPTAAARTSRDLDAEMAGAACISTSPTATLSNPFLSRQQWSNQPLDILQRPTNPQAEGRARPPIRLRAGGQVVTQDRLQRQLETSSDPTSTATCAIGAPAGACRDVAVGS
jgi:hypothetical protein